MYSAHVFAGTFGGQRTPPGVFLGHFPPHLLRQGLSLDLALNHMPGQPGYDPVLSCHTGAQCTAALWLQTHTTTLVFCVGAGDSNPDLHACVAGQFTN